MTLNHKLRVPQAHPDSIARSSKIGTFTAGLALPKYLLRHSPNTTFLPKEPVLPSSHVVDRKNKSSPERGNTQALILHMCTKRFSHQRFRSQAWSRCNTSEGPRPDRCRRRSLLYSQDHCKCRESNLGRTGPTAWVWLPCNS